MTGEVVRFERRRDLRTSGLYRQQPAPRALVRHSSVVELQVARIARLLTEFDELTILSGSASAVPLDQARADLEKARLSTTPWAASEQPASDEIEGDPQPEVDDERLEWMYRELNRDA